MVVITTKLQLTNASRISFMYGQKQISNKSDVK